MQADEEEAACRRPAANRKLRDICTRPRDRTADVSLTLPSTTKGRPVPALALLPGCRVEQWPDTSGRDQKARNAPDRGQRIASHWDGEGEWAKDAAGNVKTIAGDVIAKFHIILVRLQLAQRSNRRSGAGCHWPGRGRKADTILQLFGFASRTLAGKGPRRVVLQALSLTMAMATVRRCAFHAATRRTVWGVWD